MQHFPWNGAEKSCCCRPLISSATSAASVLRVARGFALMCWQGGWFGADRLVPGGAAMVAAYLPVSFLVTVWFFKYEIGTLKPRLEGRSA